MSRERSLLGGAVIAFIVLVALVLGLPRGRETRREPPAPSTPRSEVVPRAATRTCVRVVDGDTVVLDGDERVRLIGVDTPESKKPGTPVQYFALRASDFLRDLVQGRRVRLEYEQRRKDKHGRTLAYLYLEDGTFVNLEIVRRGFGFAYTQFPFRYLDEFRTAERAARESGTGLWAEPDSVGRPA